MGRSWSATFQVEERVPGKQGLKLRRREKEIADALRSKSEFQENKD